MRVLRIDAAFDRVSRHLDIVLAHRKWFAAGDAEHLLDEVETGDHLGDGMLDLDTRVDLDEIEFLARLLVEIFDSSGAAIANGPGERDGAGAEPLAHIFRQAYRWRLLPDLLAPALQRAFALEQWTKFLPSPRICTSMWRALSITFSI